MILAPLMLQKNSKVIKAAAKINLYLEVLGQREDGYHDIRSILVPVSLWDEMRIELTDGVIETITTISPELNCLEDVQWCDKSEKNIITRAANELKKAAGFTGGARIFLDKRIPVGGGMGGGSADAAAVLRGLNEMWELNLPTEKLVEIGARIGSDVPGLVHGGMVCIEGVGERVTGIELNGQQGWWLVLINPCFQVSTRDIYERCSSFLTSEAIPFSSICSCLRDGDAETVSKSLFNGLQETVFQKYPLIKIVVDDLKKAGAVGVLVSGSGASVFGLARDEQHANEIVKSFERDFEAPAWTRVVKTVL